MNSDPTPSERPTASTQRTCPECGSIVAERSAFCDVCGSRLDVSPSTPELAVSGTAAAGRSTRTRDLLLAGLYVVALAVLLWWVTKPEEVKGPPSGGPAAQHDNDGQAGLPAGHPSVPGSGGPGSPQGGPMQQPQMPPEMVARMEHHADSLKKVIEADPKNDSAKVKLANAYYDIERHAEAVRWYREYLRSQPKDVGARTDMAFSMASINDLDGARDELLGVLKADPKFQKAAGILVMIYMQKNNSDSTEYWLQKTADIDSTSEQGRRALDVLQGMKRSHAGDASSTP